MFSDLVLRFLILCRFHSTNKLSVCSRSNCVQSFVSELETDVTSPLVVSPRYRDGCPKQHFLFQPSELQPPWSQVFCTRVWQPKVAPNSWEARRWQSSLKMLEGKECLRARALLNCNTCSKSFRTHQALLFDSKTRKNMMNPNPTFCLLLFSFSDMSVRRWTAIMSEFCQWILDLHLSNCVLGEAHCLIFQHFDMKSTLICYLVSVYSLVVALLAFLKAVNWLVDSLITVSDRSYTTRHGVWIRLFFKLE